MSEGNVAQNYFEMYLLNAKLIFVSHRVDANVVLIVCIESIGIRSGTKKYDDY